MARSLPEMALPERLDLAEKLSDAFKREREPVMRTLEDRTALARAVLAFAQTIRERRLQEA